MKSTFQAMLGNIESHLECSICTNRFREPKLLDCHHTFCLKCLQELRASQGPRCTKLPCPLCRRVTLLNKQEVADLSNNFGMVALVDEIEKQEQLLNTKFKQDIAKLVVKAESSKTELQLAMKETDKSHKKLDAMFADTNKKISKKADKEVTRIREEERKLKLEAQKIYGDRVKSFKTARATNSKEVTQAEHKLKEVNQLMGREDYYKSSDLKQRILDTLEELTGKRPDVVSDSLAFVDFEEGEETPLGKLLVLQNEPNFGFSFGQASQPASQPVGGFVTPSNQTRSNLSAEAAVTQQTSETGISKVLSFGHASKPASQPIIGKSINPSILNFGVGAVVTQPTSRWPANRTVFQLDQSSQHASQPMDVCVSLSNPSPNIFRAGAAVTQQTSQPDSGMPFQLYEIPSKPILTAKRRCQKWRIGDDFSTPTPITAASSFDGFTQTTPGVLFTLGSSRSTSRKSRPMRKRRR